MSVGFAASAAGSAATFVGYGQSMKIKIPVAYINIPGRVPVAVETLLGDDVWIDGAAPIFSEPLFSFLARMILKRRR